MNKEVSASSKDKVVSNGPFCSVWRALVWSFCLFLPVKVAIVICSFANKNHHFLFGHEICCSRNTEWLPYLSSRLWLCKVRFINQTCVWCLSDEANRGCVSNLSHIVMNFSDLVLYYFMVATPAALGSTLVNESITQVLSTKNAIFSFLML